MKQTLHSSLELGRVRDGTHASSAKDGTNGVFFIRSPHGVNLKVISTNGSDPCEEGWEHVSVSAENRIPTWAEMCMIKDLFWDKEECVVQFHPPKSQYVNCHPYVLHLWKPPFDVPLPPRNLV
jgi:hypothetical protein